MLSVGMTRAWLAVAVLACVAVQVGAWGSYSCSLAPADKERLTNATLKSVQQVNASVSSLEEKIDTILALLASSGPQQAPWLPPPNTKGSKWNGVSGRRERSERGERSKEDSANIREDNGEEPTREEEERENVTEKPEWEDSTRIEENDETEETGPKKGECSVMVTDNHATIGMFFMNTYNHGHCANRHPITSPIRYCLGYCPTRTFVTRKDNIWGQGHECKSCQPSSFENVRIPLLCDDGFQFEKTFKNVVDCSCRNCRSSRG